MIARTIAITTKHNNLCVRTSRFLWLLRNEKKNWKTNEKIKLIGMSWYERNMNAIPLWWSLKSARCICSFHFCSFAHNPPFKIMFQTRNIKIVRFNWIPYVVVYGFFFLFETFAFRCEMFSIFTVRDRAVFFQHPKCIFSGLNNEIFYYTFNKEEKRKEWKREKTRSKYFWSVSIALRLYCHRNRARSLQILCLTKPKKKAFFWRRRQTKNIVFHPKPIFFVCFET